MEKTFPYPGKVTAADGSTAVVAAEILACTGAAAYPITPSTNMGVGFQQYVAEGTTNAWGEHLTFFEPESEHSAASVCEGYALSGGRVSNFTAGQGLILMKEVLYTISGKRLPVVFHIAARALTSHALNVHAGHDDVMGVADCGWGMIFARNAQEAGDFTLICRKTAEESFIPYFNIQDGFLTSHTVETVNLAETDLVKSYLKPAHESITNLLDPENPLMIGTVQNQDAYMKGKIAQRSYYNRLKSNLLRNFEEFYQLTGRKYNLIDTYKMEDAEYAIVGMGSYMETAKLTVDWIRKNLNIKVGTLSVISYRPFPGAEIVEALKNVKVISVLERLDESSAPENPLAREIKSAFMDAYWGHPEFKKINSIPIFQHGSGGLGGRDVRSRDFVAITQNMLKGASGTLRYCVGIKHPDAIEIEGEIPDIRPPGTFSLRGHSIGGFGSVTTNKVIAGVCQDLYGLFVQAFPKYGAEKKGLPTSYYLSVGPEKIEYHQELEIVDFVVINDTHAFNHTNPLEGLIPGGTIFIQGGQETVKEVLHEMPKAKKEKLKELNAKVYYLDSLKIAQTVASTADLLQRMQGIVLLGVFLRVTPFAQDRNLDKAQLMDSVEKVLSKYFGKRGAQVIQDNLLCVRRGFEEINPISEEWM